MSNRHHCQKEKQACAKKHACAPVYCVGPPGPAGRALFSQTERFTETRDSGYASLIGPGVGSVGPLNGTIKVGDTYTYTMSGLGQQWNLAPPIFAVNVTSSTVVSGFTPILNATVSFIQTSFTLSITFVFRSNSCYVNMSMVMDDATTLAVGGITANYSLEIDGNYIGSTGLTFDVLVSQGTASQVTSSDSGVLVKVF
jgi:hypothetical protein